MKPEEIGLLRLLSNNDLTFYIPPYQRNYEWGDEQCKIFFKDLLNTYEKNKAGEKIQHFFGTVTYYEIEHSYAQPDKLILIDGQQRLTTTMLLLIAVRDLLKKDDQRNIIDNRYLKNQNVKDDDEYKIKLKQVETDWEAYCDLIFSRDVKSKASAVYHNYLLFKSMLESFMKSNPTVDLNELCEYGLNNFTIVTIQLQPDKNPGEKPQDIFESLNSIGKLLSLADLLRNYLLMGVDSLTQEMLYQKYWFILERKLHVKLSEFIRDYMQLIARKSFKKATENNYKELYYAFKELTRKRKSEDILEELVEYSNYYAIVTNIEKNIDVDVKQKFNDLAQIKCTTVYPFTMALTREWCNGSLNKQDFLDCLDVLINYFIRRRILHMTQGENKAFPSFVMHIKKIKGATSKKACMFEILSSQENRLRLPNDKEINDNLSSMNFYNFTYNKFILALIEENITKKRPDIETDEFLQLEHIMPQTLTQEWKNSLGGNFKEIHTEYVHNIGNITLIRHNPKVSNGPFAKKKAVYSSNENLQIAQKYIITNDQWNEDTIIKRRDFLIEYLLDNVIPIPEEYKFSNNFRNKEQNEDPAKFGFEALGLIGEYIEFIDDPNIKAKVIDDKQVEFEGKKYSLSGITRLIKERLNTAYKSNKYNGKYFWLYDDEKLSNL